MTEASAAQAELSAAMDNESGTLSAEALMRLFTMQDGIDTWFSYHLVQAVLAGEFVSMTNPNRLLAQIHERLDAEET